MSKKLILFVTIFSVLMFYTDDVNAAQTNWFTINLPKGATISAQTDGIGIYAEIKNTSSTQILIEALPFKASLQDAYKLIGRKYPVLFSRQGMPERFNYSRVNGLKAEIGDKKIKGEAFCFHKDGYTVYICSYGERNVYKNISEIVNSLAFTKKAYNESQMGELVTLLKKALPYQVKSALSQIMPNGYACNDVVLNIGNGYCHFKCTLTGDYGYPHFPNDVSRSNPKAKLLAKAIKSPSIETIDAPLLSTAYLLGAKLSFSFVKPDGKQIKLDR